MSKYVTAAEFAHWVDYYYQEFSNRDDFVAYAFGAKTMKRSGVIIINRNNGKIARSYCHPDDEWDWKTGVAVAYASYMGVEIPKIEKCYFIKDLKGKEVILPLRYRDHISSIVFVTPYTEGLFTLVVDSLTKQVFRVPSRASIPEHYIKQ